ncbi:hypothetical protein OH76DRAFT_925190 [Lentinus brumalis]|uniref:Uncharacterized protein n=1 Tax=Lentinus brumalis TaxID=2498619 RepID=A0A371CZV5_9APHY|nr:hypothetical protein OH76DRAFT_925190 [Polyporus brumalis]
MAKSMERDPTRIRANTVLATSQSIYVLLLGPVLAYQNQYEEYRISMHNQILRMTSESGPWGISPKSMMNATRSGEALRIARENSPARTSMRGSFLFFNAKSGGKCIVNCSAGDMWRAPTSKSLRRSSCGGARRGVVVVRDGYNDGVLVTGVRDRWCATGAVWAPLANLSELHCDVE